VTQQESLSTLVDDFDRDRAPKSSRSGRDSNGGWKRPTVGAVAALLAIGALTWLAIGVASGPPDYGALSRQITVVDAETGDVYRKFRIREGDTEPYEHPQTGERTLYSPEWCYWNADGTARTEPTLVILNAKLGKEGPTICPDCGRTVVYHNPEPPVEILLEAFERDRQGR